MNMIDTPFGPKRPDTIRKALAALELQSELVAVLLTANAALLEIGHAGDVSVRIFSILAKVQS
jgi:hypothetical protein